MWPKGVARQERYGHDWRVIFSGSPWDSKGHESIRYVSSYTPMVRLYLDISHRAQRMICRVFLVLAAQVRPS
jgi:hypothetical protein